MMFFESLEGFFLHSSGIWEAASYPTRSQCSEIPPLPVHELTVWYRILYFLNDHH